MADVNFPVFVRGRDNYMYLIEAEDNLSFFEEIDVSGGEYVAWDADGRPVILFMDDQAVAAKYNDLPPDYEELLSSLVAYGCLRKHKSQIEPPPELLSRRVELFRWADKRR